MASGRVPNTISSFFAGMPEWKILLGALRGKGSLNDANVRALSVVLLVFSTVNLSLIGQVKRWHMFLN